MAQRPTLKLNYTTVVNGKPVRVQKLAPKGKAKFKNPVNSEESHFKQFYNSNGGRHKSL